MEFKREKLKEMKKQNWRTRKEIYKKLQQKIENSEKLRSHTMEQKLMNIVDHNRSVLERSAYATMRRFDESTMSARDDLESIERKLSQSTRNRQRIFEERQLYLQKHA
mmetsp:Transcript_9720/g.8325  ORF Transcript_9720/g.8325 Transcript_9720/m.8325 type:complete len:108 (+) Transcript_9720:166-489(+)